MPGLFSRLLDSLEPAEQKPIDRGGIERVTALILVEIARADHSIDELERDAIARALGQCSSLTPEEIESLVNEGLQEADSTLSLHEHVRVINERFSKEDKVALVEQMWRVAQADGDVDRYEEYTIRKLCDLIHVKHRDFMQAKLRVMDAGA